MDGREQLCGDLDELLEVCGDMAYRVALQSMGNIADTQDAARDVFLRTPRRKPWFTSTTREKAWILRVTVNIRKDYWEYQWLRRMAELQEDLAKVEENIDFGLLYEVMQLSVKYCNIIYLFYYERLSVTIVADILQRKEAMILIWLRRARKQLKSKLEEGDR